MIPHPPPPSESAGSHLHPRLGDDCRVANSAAPTLDIISGSRDRILATCTGLDADDWHRATPLPVWDVKDVVAHLGSLEALLLGRDEPPHTARALGHVRNPLGELNEQLVDRRRGWPEDAVLEEFRETTAARLEHLRALDEPGLDEKVMAPDGRMVPLRDFLGIRVWDYFTHELDIAAALDRPLPLDTSAAQLVLGQALMLTPRAAAKAGMADGETVVIDVGGPEPRIGAARVEGGRAVPTEPRAAGEATLHLRASPAAFALVATGRRSAEDAISRGDIIVSGDAGLAARVLDKLNVVP